MKNKIIKLVAGIIVTATVMTGCDSAQLDLDSDESATEETTEESSDEASTEDSIDSSEETSSEDSTQESTDADSEEASAEEDDDKEDKEDKEVANEYFYSDSKDKYVYSVNEFLLEEISEVPVNVEQITSLSEGYVYKLTIDYDEDCPNRFYWGVTDRFDLGTIYVTEDKIYLIVECDYVPTEEDFLDSGVVICSTEDSEIDNDGEVIKIENDGDVCTCTMSNELTESGFYMQYEWTKGKGLTHIRTGYGAEGDPIDIELK